MISGIPRHLDPQDGYLRREAKQMKREGSPPRGPSSDPMKGREGMVPTVKEAGRSIHLIPREELRQPTKEGIIAQVYTHIRCFPALNVWPFLHLAIFIPVMLLFREHP